MTDETILSIAREVGWNTEHRATNDYIVRLARTIAAAEREACAKVCEEDGLLWGQRYAAAIRSRT